DVGLAQGADGGRRRRAAIGRIAEKQPVHREAADGGGLAELDHQVVQGLLFGAVELFLGEGGVLNDVGHDGEDLPGLVDAAADRNVRCVGTGGGVDEGAQTFDLAGDLRR